MTRYEYANKWMEEYKEYNKVFEKYGVSIPEMANMQAEIEEGKYRVVVTSEKFHRTASGRWQSKPFETETKEIDARNYINIISAIPLFKDRVKKAYTKYGYLPIELTCISWGTAETKARRTFKFETIA